jgi:hypothetical protein
MKVKTRGVRRSGRNAHTHTHTHTHIHLSRTIISAHRARAEATLANWVGVRPGNLPLESWKN